MKVTMVPTGDGGHVPVPELNQSWSDLEKLQWLAALVSGETGLTITVGKARYWSGGIPQRGYYSIGMRYGRTASSSGPYNYGTAWVYLNGIQAGATAVGGQ
ncbi:Uncharacterised protein [Mycobacteroides abscessus subsp. bolletii]|nr:MULTISPECIES: hypothetical protein [Mycobacteroides]SLC85309.1 Uncharacterised protein [Mycobacteroides abscessus subsp. massiliense]OLT80124.1 hypothetical protein BKG57_08635 [Mycobacteroides chelonae]SHP62226.1 Uncharacterised protein [Mycobacteroides abscessus subsp. bolletii]SHR47386.1 Uncharacterised protein [Mycobacteroides abscessus subsp. bolletii]SHS10808.1 Uncharacterised protein [Mycobacteroides abscessus subsp. bolletii]